MVPTFGLFSVDTQGWRSLGVLWVSPTRSSVLRERSPRLVVTHPVLGTEQVEWGRSFLPYEGLSGPHNCKVPTILPNQDKTSVMTTEDSWYPVDELSRILSYTFLFTRSGVIWFLRLFGSPFDRSDHNSVPRDISESPRYFYKVPVLINRLSSLPTVVSRNENVPQSSIWLWIVPECYTVYDRLRKMYTRE